MLRHRRKAMPLAAGSPLLPAQLPSPLLRLLCWGHLRRWPVRRLRHGRLG